ncbi:MAG: diaminopimelate epimerase [Bacillota bacterium]|jgi:diaminopimelate epimerase
MHGCGNDYVFVDTVGGPGLPDGVDLARLAVELSDRRFGVGGDGMIIIGRRPSGRLEMRMFNADGSEGEMCGNGMRCLAAYAYEQDYVSGPEFEVETRAGVIRPVVRPLPGEPRRAGSVTVDLGPPREIRPGLVLTVSDGPAAGSYIGTFVSMGNPHFVVFVPAAAEVDLTATGPALENHPAFPNRTNVEFVEVLSPDRLRMRVWERGSGVTLACGTGAAASLAAAVTADLARREAVVAADGGELRVSWLPDGPILVAGPVVEVFRTTYTRPLPRLAGRA